MIRSCRYILNVTPLPMLSGFKLLQLSAFSGQWELPLSADNLDLAISALLHRDKTSRPTRTNKKAKALALAFGVAGTGLEPVTFGL